MPPTKNKQQQFEGAHPRNIPVEFTDDGWKMTAIGCVTIRSSKQKMEVLFIIQEKWKY